MWSNENLEKISEYLRYAIENEIYGAELHIYGLWAKQNKIPENQITAYLRQVMVGPDHVLEDSSSTWTRNNRKEINSLGEEIRDCIESNTDTYSKVSYYHGGYRVQLLYDINIPAIKKRESTVYEKIGDYPPLPDEQNNLLRKYLNKFSSKRISSRRKMFDLASDEKLDAIDITIKTGVLPSDIMRWRNHRQHYAYLVRDKQQIIEHGSPYPFENPKDHEEC